MSLPALLPVFIFSQRCNESILQLQIKRNKKGLISGDGGWKAEAGGSQAQ